MRLKGILFFSTILFLALGLLSSAWAEDVVYLKDGSIIHGTITEEVPGVSIKIQTKDDNVFVYKVNLIQKITHSAPAVEKGDDTAATTTTDTDNSDEDAVQAKPKPTPAPKKVVKKSNTPTSSTPNDSKAKFSKFGFLINAGFWAPDTYTQFNHDLETATGSSSYDYMAGFIKGGIGLGWFTNNFGLKWNLEMSINPNTYTTDWYYGGYYAGSTTEDTYIFIGGSEIEAELALDNVINKNNVTSFYLPLILGIWDVDYNVTDSYGTDDFTNTTTDFGTGIGFRGFDSSNLMWDLQLVYRWSQRGNYLVDPHGLKIPLVGGKFIDANVSGLDLNFTLGFM